MIKEYSSLQELIKETLTMIGRVQRLTVSQAADKYRYLRNKASYVGPWVTDEVSYMREPMDTIRDPNYSIGVFVGPAQGSKTEMLLNAILHAIVVDPLDIMTVVPTEEDIYDFYERRVKRLLENSEVLAEEVVSQSARRQLFRSSMIHSITNPTKSGLAGKPVPIVLMTDYDRMNQNTGGDGEPIDLAVQRNKTFGKIGFTMAESSPSEDNTDSSWTPETPHICPPVRGIVGLYNTGDRRRFYWPCHFCSTPFMVHHSLLRYPDTDNYEQAAKEAELACPHCGGLHPHNKETRRGEEIPGKKEMNIRGKWLKDGEFWEHEKDQIKGNPINPSRTASWMLNGVCARFSTWEQLVVALERGKRTYEKNGNEGRYKAAINTMIGEVYTPMTQYNVKTWEYIKGKGVKFRQKEVPKDARFLIACVDVQRRRFEVQIHAIGSEGLVWVIDRFSIEKSERVDEQGDPKYLETGREPEDWKLLETKVMDKVYPLSDRSNRFMRIKLTVCDSGGFEGVTSNAYAFYRYIRDKGLSHRFRLLKGGDFKTKPMVYEDFPDSRNKNRKAHARGEIPVMFINSNMMKDHTINKIEKESIHGGHKILYSTTMPDSFYKELVAEKRNPKGQWENIHKKANETFDLLVYNEAACMHPLVQVHNEDWDDPQDEEFRTWDYNPLVFTSGEDGQGDKKVESEKTLADWGSLIA